MTYKLNRNPAGEDVLHRHPSFEECNLDDAEALVELGQDTGDKLIANGTVRKCAHCFQEDESAER